MTRNPTLVVGLGRTGSLVARELQTLLPSAPGTRSPWFLLLGSPPAEEGDVALAGLGGPRNLEEVPLPMDLMRETMAGVREWSSYLPWLLRYDDASFLDEIRPLGAAGYRSFARLTTVRCDGLIDQSLRRALRQVREASPAEHVDVLLIAGAGGGLGSALLADLTFLIQRHVRKSTRTACLVLPVPGVSGRARFDANAFATLCEVSCLKGMRFPYEIRFESLPSIDARSPGDEPWQRVYLFEAQEGEDVPYPGSARRVAETLALQLQPRVARHRRQVAQDFTAVRVSPGPWPARLEKTFSTCQALHFDLPREVPGVYREDPITAALLDRAWEAFFAALDRDLLALREPLYEARKRDLGELHGSLAQRENALLRAVAPEEAVEKPVTVLLEAKVEGRRSRRRQEVRVKAPVEEGKPIVLRPQELRGVPGMEAAFLSIHRDLKEPPPVLPVARLPESPDGGQRQPAGQELLRDLKEQRSAADALWPGVAPAGGGAGKARRFAFLSLRRNMVWNLDQRIATLQALLRAPDFRPAFDEAVRVLAHEWLGYRKEVVAPDPSFAPWLAELERRILDTESSVFTAAAPQAERRLFSVALLPEALPPGFDREVLRGRLSHAVQTAFQCTPKVLDVPDDRIVIYFEDLFHDAGDLARLPLYRAAYAKEPVKELFHTDYRFVPLCKSFSEDDDRSPLPCGNPGCGADLRLLRTTALRCPSCGGAIRSRCGNPGCRVRDLHLRPEAAARTCPGCRGLNRSAWWVCCRHGKVEVLVPMDKERCPECVLCHHEDPVQFPVERISLRPDLVRRRTCWSCEELARKDPAHLVFEIPEELDEFVQNGVNGHDRDRFTVLAEKHGLPDGFRCPNCRAPLITVDHRGFPEEGGA